MESLSGSCQLMKLIKMTFVSLEYVNVIAHVFKGSWRLPFPSSQHADRAKNQGSP